MWDVPEHMLIPVDVDGNGPAEPPDAHHLACWCGDSLCDRAVAELVAEVRGLRAQLDTLRNAIEKLIPWAESYRMHHVAIALRGALAAAAAVPSGDDTGPTTGGQSDG